MGKPHKSKDPYTAQRWRDLGHVRWEDPLSALEDPRSPEFKAAVATEDAIWSQGILSPRLRDWNASMKHYQTVAHPIHKRYAETRFRWCGRTVLKQRGPSGYTYTVWVGDWHLDRAWYAVGFGSDGWFYTLEDIGKGAEHLELTVWHWPMVSAQPRPVWRRDPVGPSVEILENRIYFSTVENLLRYPDLWVAPIATGRGAKCLFTEPDKRYQLRFTVRDGPVLFLHKANALDQMLGILKGETVHWIATEHSTLIPIASDWYGTNDSLRNYENNRHIPLPKGEYLVDACVGGPERGLLVVTTNEGRETLWSCTTQWRPLTHGNSLNSIQILHEPTPNPTFLFRTPMKPDAVWEYLGGAQHRMQHVLEYPEPLRLPYFDSGSARNGNVRVPYTWVSAIRNPRALIVEAYGSYGISARRSYPVRWLPYLAAGWAVAYACPRGGREGGDAWYDGGRTAARKANTFEDTVAAIRALQHSLHVGPNATVFFGRSAGGWLAANIAQDHGDLVAAVYAEVPYVDVLRTTTNPRLPLTQLEYDEFGDPARRPAEYRALRKLSPVDTVPMCVARQCPLLVIRTALHDKQVLPYEVLKWATRLREAGWDRVYVGIDHDGGHFAGAKSMAEQRAEDSVLLERAVEYKHMKSPQGTRAARTVRKKSTKRSRSSVTTGKTRRLRRTSS
jgi:pimeloyl-ACP methyl ester carboxylesterase